eukprot:TRINITY_DN10789_c0_g1_i1.p1 TRINITY_DN10789_c0_g1~~TRINITY_DN10789_c0_g1_i1.p1  ORF type:complete len:303 (+),score=12.04 TRINITY_DN10789_c0_g1_i1:213-1121(+)
MGDFNISSTLHPASPLLQVVCSNFGALETTYSNISYTCLHCANGKRSHLDQVFVADTIKKILTAPKTLNPYFLSDHLPLTFSLQPSTFLPKRAFLSTHWYTLKHVKPVIQMIISAARISNVAEWLKVKNAIIDIIIAQSGRKNKPSIEPLTERQMIETYTEWLITGRIKWAGGKECPSKFLSTTLALFSCLSHINSYINSSNAIEKDPSYIASTISNQFQNLYNPYSLPSLLPPHTKVKKIPPNLKAKLTQSFTEKETLAAIQKMKPTSSPGPDALMVKFYPTYHVTLVPVLIRTFNSVILP